MDTVLVAVGTAISLVLALTLVLGFLVARSRRRRRQAKIVTVAELLEEATERGEGIRLNWSRDDLDANGRAVPPIQDQYPTVILPKMVPPS